MVKDYDGKHYDTANAEKLAAIDNGLPYSDPRNKTDTLYRTCDGDHFLYVRCGPENYFVRGTNHHGWIRMIVPLNRNEAQAWAQQHLEQEAISQIFGRTPGNSSSRMQINVPSSTAYRMKCKAAVQNMTVSELIDRTLPY